MTGQMIVAGLTKEGIRPDPAGARVGAGTGWRIQDDRTGHDISGRLTCRHVLWTRTPASLGPLPPPQLYSSRHSELRLREDRGTAPLPVTRPWAHVPGTDVRLG